MTKLPLKISIRSMLLAPMLAVNLLIIIIFIITIFSSNIYFRIKESEVCSMSRVVEYRGERLESTFTRLDLLLDNMAGEMEKEINSMFADQTQIGPELKASAELASIALNSCRPYLTDALLRNDATGAFVLLDTSITDPPSGGIDGNRAACIYFNDDDMASARSNNNLTLYCGSKQIARDMAIPLDSSWNMELQLDAIDDRRFTQPFTQAAFHPELTQGQLGYWSRPFTRADGKEVIFYTMPLRDGMGQPYGLAGMEISLDFLRTKLGILDIGYDDHSFCALTIMQDGNTQPEWLVGNGTYFNRLLNGAPITRRTLLVFGELASEITFEDGMKVTAITYPFQVYYSASVFGQETWELIGGVENRELFSEANNLAKFFVIALLGALLVGAGFSVLGSNLFVRPVTRLAGQLYDIDPEQKLALPQTNIAEVDLLITAIEQLIEDLVATGRRTIETVEMTGMPMGFMETNNAMKRVYLTDYLFALFGLEKEGESNFIPLSLWEAIEERIRQNADISQENIYLLDFVEHQPFRWLRIKTARSSTKTFGIIMDVTDEMLEKRRLEFERDTDPLTGLANRYAFFLQAQKKICEKPGRLGVMLFADLDNLKYVNDTYGHDFGDRYIRAAANIFNQFALNGGVVARISGDEFAVFIYGYDTKEELIRLVSQTYETMDTTLLAVPDSSEIKVRCSMGFSWYPSDSSDLEQLLRYADFAMYETKRTTKGSIREFSIESYLKNSYLVEKNEEFNQFIEQNQVAYAFQPIVDIFSGSIFAYEALMRPQAPELKTAYHVLQIARNQAKLYQIEQMTIFNVYRWIHDNEQALGEAKIFFNSIPNQMLSERDMAELSERYHHLFSRTVVELTEDEHCDEKFFLEKIAMVRRLGSGIAIDDFGAGYSNEMSVFNASPNFIKLDFSLVHNAHLEENKRRLIANIISYAHPLHIKIIAEGVETYEEAEIMIKLGVDYLQGFYVARPSMELEPLSEKIGATLRRLSNIHRDRRTENR